MNLQKIHKILDKRINFEKRARISYEQVRQRYENGNVEKGSEEEKKLLEGMGEDFLKRARKAKERLAQELKGDFVAKEKQYVNFCLLTNIETSPEILREIWEIGPKEKLMLMAKHPNAPADILDEIYKMGYYQGLVLNPNLSPTMLEEIFKKHYPFSLSRESVWKISPIICEAIATNPNTPPKILRKLAQGISAMPQPNYENWTYQDEKNLECKVAGNPNTPEKTLRELLELNNYMIKRNILANSGISEDFLYEIIGFDVDVVEGRKPIPITGTLKEYATSILENQNLSPEMIRRLEEQLTEFDYPFYALESLLNNPKTPEDILKKYLNEIDYSKLEQDSEMSRILRAVLLNPSTPSECLEQITTGLEEHSNDFFGNIIWVLDHKNTPYHILQKYLDIDEEQSGGVLLFNRVLGNPSFFEFLEILEKDITRSEDDEIEL